MNNSKITLDEFSLSLEEPVDRSEQLRMEESRLIRIIEAIDVVLGSDGWSNLNSLIFANRIESLESQLKAQVEQAVLNQPEIYRLQGRLYEARKYDLDKMSKTFRTDLSHIKKLII